MYQRTITLPGVAAAFQSSPGGTALLAVLGAGLAGTALVFSNPGPSEFEGFAAERLVDVLETELCQGDALPGLMRMALGDCSRLVQDQRLPIARLVGRHSRRLDLGVASVYRSELGGGMLLGWPVPRFRATVLAVAGHFLILQADTSPSETRRQQQP
jgi:hypothetical protein